MHLIAIDPSSRLFIRTRFAPAIAAWDTPRARLQLRTDTERGVILDFGDLAGLRLLASATHHLLADYRQHVLPARRPSRTLPPFLPD